jgi:acetoacetyl-CoA synthetase
VTIRGRICWNPTDDAWSQSRLADFAKFVALDGGPSMVDYRSALAWSLSDIGPFWAALSRWAGVRWHAEPVDALASNDMPGAVWFPGGTLNYAEHALRHAALAPDELAIIAHSQTRASTTLSWRELVDQVARCRAGLIRLGVGRGDRVVAFAPNIPETLVAFLATASIGAIWSSCAPEFGVRAVVDRWSQIDPVVMIAVDGYRYGARAIDRSAAVDEIVAELPTLRHVVRVPYLDSAGPDGQPDEWSDLLADHEPLTYEAVPFDHPLYVLSSSGTTGLPKPIVHGHGGITLEHHKTLALHYDLRPGDRVMWFTTTGWMMWNFLASGLLTGSTIALFDGDPAAPDLVELWRRAADDEIDVFGVSAPFIMACRKAGLEPASEVDLSRLRHLGSTGAPLPGAGVEWAAAAVGSHVQVGSMSGGTDVCTAFVGTAPMLPIRAGEISARMLGCDVRAVDQQGRRCGPGETGELVIASPMPSMPVGLWGDDDGERLRDTYYSTYPGIWRHGDWITFHDDGACEISGRSDATLNRGGVRLGTSDFYTVIEGLDQVADSVVIHLEDDEGGSGELILLVACAGDERLDDDLVAQVRAALRTELSPRHVPDTIAEVAAVPRTLSGKKLEVPIKKMLLGAEPDRVASRDSLADPTALDAIADWIATRRS